MENLRFFTREEEFNGLSPIGTPQDTFVSNVETTEKNIVCKHGRKGEKNHVYKAIITKVGDSEIIVYSYPVCGTYSSTQRTFILGSDISRVNCQKCLNILNK